MRACCICVCDADDCRRSAPALETRAPQAGRVTAVMDVCSESFFLVAAVGFVGILLVS